MNRVEKQAAAYRRLMGREALERQFVPTRCPDCLGTLPYGHRRSCPWWGGREPAPKR